MRMPEGGSSGGAIGEPANRGGMLAVPLRFRWYRRLADSKFAINVAVMLAGTMLGQAASVLLSPLLTRLYAPEQFGYLSVYTSVLTLLGVVAALGYELAIPISASETELGNLVAGCLIVLTGMIALVSLAAGLTPERILAALWLGPLAAHRMLLPLGFACLGGYSVMVAAATRIGSFREIALTRISQGISGPVSQILLGVMGAGGPGLALGFVIGQSSGTFLLGSRVLLGAPALRAALSWQAIGAALWRYVRFPLLASWAGMLDMAGSGTVLFLVFASCYSPEVAGYMFLAERVILRPLLIVSTSLLQVFTGEVGPAIQREPARFRRRFRQVVRLQFAVSAAWILLANVVSGWAFPLLFGGRWAAAVPYLGASSVAYLALAVLHPVSSSLQLMERQLLAASWQAARLLLVATAVGLAYHLGWSAVTALWLTSLAQAIACITMLGLIANCSRTLQRQVTPR